MIAGPFGGLFLLRISRAKYKGALYGYLGLNCWLGGLMVHLYRVIVGCICFWAVSVFACPLNSTCSAPKWHSGTAADWSDSPDTQMSRYIVWVNANASDKSIYTYASGGGCSQSPANNVYSALCPQVKTPKNGGAQQTANVTMYPVCPTSASSGGVGTFSNSGGSLTYTVGIGLECVGVTPQQTCLTKDVGFFSFTGDIFEACNAGCAIVLTKGYFDPRYNTTNGTWHQNGNNCSVSSGTSTTPVNDTNTDKAKSCGANLCPIVIGGTSLCTKCEQPKETSTDKSAESSSTTASGASSPTSSSQSSGSSSSKSSCNGDTCTKTTTETITNPDGSTTSKTSSDTKDKASFCADNPGLSICKDDQSVWGGTCEGGFTCQADAVQCAQAQAAWQSACQGAIDKTSSSYIKGLSAVSSGDRPGDHPLNSATSTALDLSSRLDATPLFGNSADCPVDKNITVIGKTVVLPFGSLCPYLRMLGAAFMASCYLSAAFIVFKG